jgi:hypothetical protein
MQTVANGPPATLEEFKGSVVDHWCHGERRPEQVAKNLASRYGTSAIVAAGYDPTHKPVDPSLPERAEDLKRELQQLRNELARVTTLEILKKPWGFFI